MIVKQIISELMPSLKPTDTVSKALYLMESFKTTHLPIVLNDDYLGLVSEIDLLDIDYNKPIIDNKLIINDFSVIETQHIYNAINIISDNKLSLLPVLSIDKKYIGHIMLQDLLVAIKTITSVGKIGSILILEISQRDYALTEIANIVESENVKIINLHTWADKENKRLNITLKFNTDEILPVIKSFERYNYHIKSVFSNNEKSNKFYSDRLDELLFYLNI